MSCSRCSLLYYLPYTLPLIYTAQRMDELEKSLCVWAVLVYLYHTRLPYIQLAQYPRFYEVRNDFSNGNVALIQYLRKPGDIIEIPAVIIVQLYYLGMCAIPKYFPYVFHRHSYYQIDLIYFSI